MELYLTSVISVKPNYIFLEIEPNQKFCSVITENRINRISKKFQIKLNRICMIRFSYFDSIWFDFTLA